MSRYAVKFRKTGYIKYTSHLDMLRLFKRIIKRSDIKLKYSQGFNPHPKLGFVQPLSLGYESICEIIEIETVNRYSTVEIVNRLNERVPDGIIVTDCSELTETGKSLASRVYEADYIISFPFDAPDDISLKLEGYLNQEIISAMKKQKKTKELKEINIKPMIKGLKYIPSTENMMISLKCDCGSDSNLSPELVISSLKDYLNIDFDRSEVEVTRNNISIRGYHF